MVCIEELEEVERGLGSPLLGDGPLTLRRVREADEREEFPVEALRTVHSLGFFDELVPSELGGRYVGPSRLLEFCRLLSRRDLTVAVAVGQSFLGATPVWLEGSVPQRARVASLLSQGQVGAVALTEEEHGSDLLAGEFAAMRVEGSPRRRMLGRKWAINNATRGAFYCVLARTDARGGPNGFTFVLLDREALPPGAIEPLPKLRTFGIRGADISGFVAHDVLCDDACLVGPEGGGFELALKTLQVTRTLCAGFALGCADTALRTTLRFALDRTLYGRPVTAMEHVQSSLAEAYAMLLGAEAVARRACRTLERLPEEGAIASCVAKVVAPVFAEEIVAMAARVLGARAHLREVHEFGAFEKLRRDVAVVGLFDGSVPVNLAALAAQLPLLASSRRSASRTTQANESPPRPLLSKAMRVTAKADHVVALMLADPSAATTLQPLQESVVRGCREIDESVVRALAEQRTLFQHSGSGSQLSTSSRGQELAWRYALAHACSCVLMPPADDPARSIDIVAATAHVLVARMEGRRVSLTPAQTSALWARLVGQYDRCELFSVDRIRIEA